MGRTASFWIPADAGMTNPRIHAAIAILSRHSIHEPLHFVRFVTLAMCKVACIEDRADNYSITFVACTSSDCGTLMPSAFAVFMLMNNSNFVGCSTGSSPGLAPLNILSI